MNETENQSLRGPFSPNLGDLEKHWGWMLVLGGAFLILGTIGLGMVFFLTVASILAFGFLLLIGGGFQLVHAFMYCKGWSGILSHGINALLYVILGAIIVNDPVVATTLLTLIMGVILIVIGALRAITALQNRGAPAWGWALLSGIASLVIGFMIVADWPASGLWAIGLFIALDLIIAGWSYVFMALAVRRIGKEA